MPEPTVPNLVLVRVSDPSTGALLFSEELSLNAYTNDPELFLERIQDRVRGERFETLLRSNADEINRLAKDLGLSFPVLRSAVKNALRSEP